MPRCAPGDAVERSEDPVYERDDDGRKDLVLLARRKPPDWDRRILKVTDLLALFYTLWFSCNLAPQHRPTGRVVLARMTGKRKQTN
jgi:hypothetical protein